MKRLVLLMLITMVVITVGVIPRAVYGIDYSMLTEEEKSFSFKLGMNYGWLEEECQRFEGIIKYPFNNKSEIEFAYIKFPKVVLFELDSSPAVYEGVRTEWNDEILPAYRNLRNSLYACFANAMEHPDSTVTHDQLKDCLRKLEPECKQLQKRAWEVKERCLDIEYELIEKRKEVREKAKPVLERIRDLLKEPGTETESDKDDKAKPEADNDKEKANPISELIEDLLKEPGTEAGKKAKDDEDKSEADKDKKDGEEDCFIATAAYGSPAAVEIDILRQFRDEFLLHNYPGRAFVDFYYTTSPPIATFISEHDMLRVTVREGFVDPIVAVVEFTESWWAE